MNRFYEGQELKSKQTGERYEFIKPVEGDETMVWCKLLLIDMDGHEHTGTISKDRLEPVERRSK